MKENILKIIHQRIHHVLQILRRCLESRRKTLFWVYLLFIAVLLTLALLYVFLWKQPDITENIVNSQTPTPTPVLSSVSATQSTSITTTESDVTAKLTVIPENLKELHDQYSDIVGWIIVDNTNINYPIVQSVDNAFYMDKNIYKEYNYPGSIFLDFRCDFNNMFEATHHIIYGHNMKNGTMFQQLTKYQDETFFNESRYININTLYGNYVFEVFAAYETPISFLYREINFSSRQKWLDFINVFQEKSAFDTDIILDSNDVVITLSTCTNSHNNNLRFVVQAKLVTS